MAGLVIVLLLRLLSPFLLFVWPFVGGLLMIIVDYFDLNILEAFHSNLAVYQPLDKTLDMYYMVFEFGISLGWKNRLAKVTSTVLFLERVIGYLLFIAIGNEIILVIFPNAFEVFYLFYMGFRKILRRELLTSIKGMILIVSLIYIFKIGHEYLLHFNTTHPWINNKYIQVLINSRS